MLGNYLRVHVPSFEINFDLLKSWLANVGVFQINCLSDFDAIISYSSNSEVRDRPRCIRSRYKFYRQYSLIEQVKEPCLGTPSVKQEGINSEKYSLPLDGIQSEKCNALQLPQQH